MDRIITTLNRYIRAGRRNITRGGSPSCPAARTLTCAASILRPAALGGACPRCPAAGTLTCAAGTFGPAAPGGAYPSCPAAATFWTSRTRGSLSELSSSGDVDLCSRYVWTSCIWRRLSELSGRSDVWTSRTRRILSELSACADVGWARIWRKLTLVPYSRSSPPLIWGPWQ